MPVCSSVPGVDRRYVRGTVALSSFSLCCDKEYTPLLCSVRRKAEALSMVRSPREATGSCTSPSRPEKHKDCPPVSLCFQLRPKITKPSNVRETLAGSFDCGCPRPQQLSTGGVLPESRADTSLRLSESMTKSDYRFVAKVRAVRTCCRRISMVLVVVVVMCGALPTGCGSGVILVAAEPQDTVVIQGTLKERDKQGVLKIVDSEDNEHQVQVDRRTKVEVNWPTDVSQLKPRRFISFGADVRPTANWRFKERVVAIEKFHGLKVHDEGERIKPSLNLVPVSTITKTSRDGTISAYCQATARDIHRSETPRSVAARGVKLLNC